MYACMCLYKFNMHSTQAYYLNTNFYSGCDFSASLIVNNQL